MVITKEAVKTFEAKTRENGTEYMEVTETGENRVKEYDKSADETRKTHLLAEIAEIDVRLAEYSVEPEL